MNFLAMMESAREYVATERPQIYNATDAADILRPLLQGEPQECLFVLELDAKLRVIDIVPVTVGLVDSSQSHAREVFRSAIIHSASKVIIAHNHPSGHPEPSAQDIHSTRGLVEAGRIIGIPVADHIIIGHCTPSRACDFVSMKDQGLI